MEARSSDLPDTNAISSTSHLSWRWRSLVQLLGQSTTIDPVRLCLERGRNGDPTPQTALDAYGNRKARRNRSADTSIRRLTVETSSAWRGRMAAPERYDALVLGSGQGGKLLAWDLARSGRRTAVVERRWIGGSCPNINCMPSKNEIWSAGVAHVARHAAEFGVMTDRVAVDMGKVRQRKRDMVDWQVDAHLRAYKDSGAELIMGTGRFVAPKTLEVGLNGGGARVLHADKVFLNVGTRAMLPDVLGLDPSGPLT